jgi:hypothetical protein
MVPHPNSLQPQLELAVEVCQINGAARFKKCKQFFEY